jgi:predicted protein tyrosine phosphatase
MPDQTVTPAHASFDALLHILDGIPADTPGTIAALCARADDLLAAVTDLSRESHAVLRCLEGVHVSVGDEFGEALGEAAGADGLYDRLTALAGHLMAAVGDTSYTGAPGWHSGLRP